MFFATWKKNPVFSKRKWHQQRENRMSNEDKDGHDIKHPQPQPRGARITWPGYKFLVMLKPVWTFVFCYHNQGLDGYKRFLIENDCYDDQLSKMQVNPLWKIGSATRVSDVDHIQSGRQVGTRKYCWTNVSKVNKNNHFSLWRLLKIHRGRQSGIMPCHGTFPQLQ